jgi:hypothetical protein
MLEMKLVLRSVLSKNELRHAANGLELSRRRAITVSPGHGALTVLNELPATRNGKPARGRQAVA